MTPCIHTNLCVTNVGVIEALTDVDESECGDDSHIQLSNQSTLTSFKLRVVWHHMGIFNCGNVYIWKKWFSEISGLGRLPARKPGLCDQISTREGRQLTFID